MSVSGDWKLQVNTVRKWIISALVRPSTSVQEKSACKDTRGGCPFLSFLYCGEVGCNSNVAEAQEKTARRFSFLDTVQTEFLVSWNGNTAKPIKFKLFTLARNKSFISHLLLIQPWNYQPLLIWKELKHYIPLRVMLHFNVMFSLR